MTKFARTTSVCLAILVSWTVLEGTSFAKKNANLEFWQTTAISFDLDEENLWGGYVSQETKHGRHNGNPYLYNVDMGLVYRGLADWLDVGISFKKEYEKDGPGKFRHENRPHLNFTLKGKLFNLDTSNRIRIEYRDREHKKSVYRLRNKTTFKIPCKKLAEKGMQPFIAEEFFMNLGENNINQNRLYAGFSWKIAKHIKSNIWYMWKASRGGSGWVNTNVIGTDLKFPF